MQKDMYGLYPKVYYLRPIQRSEFRVTREVDFNQEAENIFQDIRNIVSRAISIFRR